MNCPVILDIMDPEKVFKAIIALKGNATNRQKMKVKEDQIYNEK